MKNSLIVANWKSNFTSAQAVSWLEEFAKEYSPNENKKVILCPNFILLPSVSDYIKNSNIEVALGAQDVSPFEKGAYTGEVPASLLKSYVEFSVIGHSERRENFHEDEDMLKQKVSMAAASGVTPIYCVSNEDMIIPMGATIVAYEPLSAIGTGNPDSPERANEIAGKIKERNINVSQILYGGSVTSDNVKSFIQMDNIDGVLVGSASLNASGFLQIVQNA